MTRPALALAVAIGLAGLVGSACGIKALPKPPPPAGEKPAAASGADAPKKP